MEGGGGVICNWAVESGGEMTVAIFEMGEGEGGGGDGGGGGGD